MMHFDGTTKEEVNKYLLTLFAISKKSVPLGCSLAADWLGDITCKFCNCCSVDGSKRWVKSMLLGAGAELAFPGILGF